MSFKLLKDLYTLLCFSFVFVFIYCLSWAKIHGIPEGPVAIGVTAVYLVVIVWMNIAGAKAKENNR